MLISAVKRALQMVASGCRPPGSLTTSRLLSATIILPCWKISRARSGSLRTIRMMAQSAESTTVRETIRMSVTSNRRTRSMRAPIRFSRKTLNWRTLGQSRPRAVSKSIPVPSPKLMPDSGLSGGEYKRSAGGTQARGGRKGEPGALHVVGPDLGAGPPPAQRLGRRPGDVAPGERVVHQLPLTRQEPHEELGHLV